VIPQEQKAGWSSFIKVSYRGCLCHLVRRDATIPDATLTPDGHRQSLASMTGDLSSMTAPPFILSPVSLTEFPGKVPWV
jgi:hypothetical protein